MAAYCYSCSQTAAYFLTGPPAGGRERSAVLPGISEGWPRILSDLKTLLETGDTLPVG